jgi:O-antigen ligase
MVKLETVSPQRTLGRNQILADPNSNLENEAGVQTLPAGLGYGLLLLVLAAAPWFFSSFWVANNDFFAQIEFLACTALAALLLATSGLRRGRFQLLDWLLVGFVAWCALSVATSVYRHDSLLELGRVTGIVIWFFVVRAYLMAPGGENRLPALTGAAVGGISLVAAYALSDYIVTRNPREFGTYITPNLLANALAMALPFALILPVILRRRFRHSATISAIFPFVLLLAGLVVTSSKGGIFSALVGLFVMAVAISRARPGAVGAALKRVWPFLAVGAVLFGALAFRTIIPRLRSSFGGDDYSTLFRVYTWKATWAMALAKPLLGHGLGTFSVALPKYAIASYTRHAHEVWLQLAAECGLPAMLLLAAATLVALVSGWRQLKTPNWPYAAAAIGAVVAFVLHGLSDSGWSVTSIALLLMVCFAILGGTDVAEPNSEPGARLSYSWVGASLLTLGGVMLSMRAFNAEDSIMTSERLIKAGAPAMSLIEAQKALDSDPDSFRANNQVARALVVGGDIEKALPYYQRSTELAPTRASNWMNVAEASNQLGDVAAARKNYDRAVEVDPNNTMLLLARGEWLISQKDSAGYKDLQRIVWLWDQPYGKYQPTPEFVNLDFTRATLELLPQMMKAGQNTEAKRLVTKATGDVANALLHDASNRAIAASSGDGEALQIPEDLQKLVDELAPWQQKFGISVPYNKSS